MKKLIFSRGNILRNEEIAGEIGPQVLCKPEIQFGLEVKQSIWTGVHM